MHDFSMRFLLISIAALFLAACDDDFAQSSTSPKDAAEKMSSLVALSPSFGRVPQQCPIVVYQSRAMTGGEAANCDQNPAACLAQCDAGNAGACFDAARTIEKGQIPNDSHLTYPLFMAACALGEGNACVNAAATVRNGEWSQARPTATQTAQCQFQTYDRMCKDGHPWGCYMVAGEYRRSDGFVPRNASLADASMQRACALDATSGACLDQYKPDLRD